MRSWLYPLCRRIGTRGYPLCCAAGKPASPTGEVQSLNLDSEDLSRLRWLHEPRPGEGQVHLPGPQDGLRTARKFGELAPEFHFGTPEFHFLSPEFHFGTAEFEFLAREFDFGTAEFHFPGPEFDFGTAEFHFLSPEFHFGTPEFHFLGREFHFGAAEFEFGTHSHRGGP